MATKVGVVGVEELDHVQVQQVVVVTEILIHVEIKVDVVGVEELEILV